MSTPNTISSSQYENSQRRFKNECRRIAAKALELAKKATNPAMRKSLMEMYHRNMQRTRIVK